MVKARVYVTDSNMLNYGPLLEFIKDEVLPQRMVRKKKYEEYMEAFDLRILNTLSLCASAGISETLWNYLGYIHVAEEDRKYIKMKNEFYYSRLIVTFAMKSYMALLKRREEVVLKEAELDVKGVSFFKSTASKETSDFIYEKILMGELFNSPDGKLSLKRTYRAIQDFQKHVKKEVLSGNMGFMRQSVKVKSADAYANPMSIGQYKSTWVWNQLCEEHEQITYPAIVTQIKVKLANKKDAAALAPWPEIYDKVIKLFERNPDIGDHVEYDKSTGKPKIVKGKGIKSIALPDSVEKVPDWLLAIIDVETITRDNMSLFTQIMLPLGFVAGNATHRGASMTFYNNIVRI